MNRWRLRSGARWWSTLVPGNPLCFLRTWRDYLNTGQDIKAFAISVFAYKILIRYTGTCNAYTYRMDQDCLLKSPKRGLHPSFKSAKGSLYCGITYLRDKCLRYRRWWAAEKFIDNKRGLTKRERKSCIPIVEISIPSIIIRPLIGSTYGRFRERKAYMDYINPQIWKCSWPTSIFHFLSGEVKL